MAQDAVIALKASEAAAAEATTAARHADLEAERDAANKLLAGHLGAVEGHLSALVAAVQSALVESGVAPLACLSRLRRQRAGSAIPTVGAQLHEGKHPAYKPQPGWRLIRCVDPGPDRRREVTARPHQPPHQL